MWRKNIHRMLVLLILIAITVVGCQHRKSEDHDLIHVKSEDRGHQKKVIMLLVDSLMAQSVDKGIRQQELPTFQWLIEHGQYHKDLVSSFPTMSVSIDSSLLTGKYPDAHHMPGLIWYSSDDQRIINYGTGPMEIVRQGTSTVLTDALIHLNGNHLNPNLPTIYEDLARRGLKSGSINGLVYRGNTDHRLKIPGWMHQLSSLGKEIKVKGPDFLAFGSLSNPLEGTTNLPDGLTKKMGFNNMYSVEAVKYLIQANKLPDFLYVYLPDIDQELHKKGPSELSGLKKVDGQLESLLLTFGSREKALDEAVFMILGDSGMTHILPADQNPVIDLPAMFGGAHVLRPGESVSKDTEIVLAVNETMAYVYLLKEDRPLRGIADLLSKDPRIDFVSWQEKDWIYAMQGKTAKQFKYKANGNLVDQYNQTWTVQGDEEVLGVKVNAEIQTLDYSDYPDVLRRLAGVLNSHKGKFLVVTAKPGYELADRSSPTHKGGGGHGSIRATESLVPLIICGTKQKPEHLRMIDLKPYVLDLLTTKDIQRTG